MIRFEQITKTYGKRIVLDNISCNIPKGKITSLIGPNGAGKSTLLSIISRLLDADQGKIYLDDLGLDDYKSEDLAKRLSILRQSNHIDLRLTVRDLVAFGRFPYSKGRLTAEDQAQIDKAIHFAQLEDMAHSYIDELSGGQRQRAFIAMIIAQDTDYILLDEPLNNLDMKHAVLVMKTLRRLVDELGKTVVIVIHEINFASQYSDYIIAMKDGKIVHNDETDQVVQAHTLKEVFGIDFDIITKNGKNICNYFNIET